MNMDGGSKELEGADAAIQWPEALSVLPAFGVCRFHLALPALSGLFNPLLSMYSLDGIFQLELIILPQLPQLELELGGFRIPQLHRNRQACTSQSLAVLTRHTCTVPAFPSSPLAFYPSSILCLACGVHRACQALRPCCWHTLLPPPGGPSCLFLHAQGVHSVPCHQWP